jgi:predicted phosphodiesterase
MKTLVIGDSHGKFNGFIALAKFALENYEGIGQIVSAGDFGIWDFTSLTNPFSIPLRFIDGNHECFPMIESGTYRKNFVGIDYIPRGTIDNGILYCGGASSLYMGNEGIDWFPEENISYRQFNEIAERIENFIKENGEGSIQVMVCHDTIMQSYKKIISVHETDRDSNAMALESMWRIANPQRYVHGHHHVTMTYFETNERDEVCQFNALNMCGGFGRENLIEVCPERHFDDCCVILST